jgi:hypothetical protein
VSASYWRTTQRGNETWVVLNTVLNYFGDVQTAGTAGLAVLTSLPLPIDITNPVLQDPGTNPAVGAVWTDVTAGFTGLALATWNDVDEIWINIRRASTTSGVSGASTLAIWMEYPTPS